VWDSAAFSSIFLASSFSCSQTLSTPAHTQVTQTVGQPKAKTNSSLIRKFRFIVEFRKANLFFSGGVFSSLRFESGFQQAGFQVLVFGSTSFLSSAKFRVHFVESLKSASRFLVWVLVNVGFDWLCFVASILFVVGFVGSQNWLVFL
jgi:hypothetical protein